MEEEPWASGEIIPPNTHDRIQIWEQLGRHRTPPNITHFRIIQGDLEITALTRCPKRQITLFPKKFPVSFKIELVEGRTATHIVPGMPAEHIFKEA
jgi:hypothetical protein